jgi:redox-sensitive bicupin YhaK (pirin superfamily)
MTTKQVHGVLPTPHMHWVGDGFPVRSVLSPQSVGDRMSPFVLMDHAGPADFEPARDRRGVGFHPHRGFETVTIVYSGEIEHQDTAGNRGVIGPGDVQWMTAARGVFHEEMHSAAFTKKGGPMEMAQIWVNLPKKDKLGAPRYQDLKAAQIPVVQLDGGAGSARLIAGSFGNVRGAAHTFSPVILWDVALAKGARTVLPIPAGHNAAIFARNGLVEADGTYTFGPRQMAVLDRDGAGVTVHAPEGADLIVLAGEPLGEPVVQYGPFVMNTWEEIVQAMNDVESGQFGRVS